MTAERAAKLSPRDAAARDAAMSQLLIGMQGRLRAFLAKLNRGDAGDVDDLSQETLARAWRSRGTYDAELGDGESWLLRIAFRAFLDARKKNGTSVIETRELVGNERDPAHHAAVRDHTAALLGCLSPIERDVLLRFHRDGTSIDEIARTLKMPSGTIKSHLHRARNRLWASERRTDEQKPGDLS